MVAKAKADPSDFVRAYTPKFPMPEHVVAHFAVQRIESALREQGHGAPAPGGDPANDRK